MLIHPALVRYNYSTLIGPAPFDRGSGVGSHSRSFAEGTAADVAAPAAVAASGCDETSLSPCVSQSDRLRISS